MSRVRTLSGWSLSLLLILSLHALIGLWAMYWTVQAEPLELPPAAMMIELEPLPAPPPAPTAVPEPEPEPLPEVAEAPKAPLAVPPKPKVQPKPQPPRPKPTKPEPPQKQEAEPAQEVASQPRETPRDNRPAAPQTSSASTPSDAERSWQSQLFNHLARYKRYPEDARRRGLKGINRLRFVIDGNGRVLSYELTEKAGSAVLDRATLQTIRRAQPLPRPPAELLNNGTLEIVAPFVYALEQR
ncbi:energy transducer TonB [Pseudomonas sp. NCCP-436]|uniref:energy transducer TonB n=1 Tax=Pseudomonas sp. NCCP-436 TaxID=2842481 RepID=UPI001C820F30|nr:energy transducer TonB [Pseudomonas sp. NCCP-436]GIZ13720.1 hypothetical protein NCCP436_31360 [Pseudomonas sp. NCCP-436]